MSAPDWLSGTNIQIVAAIVSALSALASAAFAGFLYRLGQKQLQTSDRQANIAAQQVETANKQTEIADRQADIAEQVSAQDARLLVLTQRPRVVVDLIAFMGDDPNQFPGGSLPTVRLEVLNVGGTPAQIEATSCMFYFDPSGLPPRMTWYGANQGPLFNLDPETVIQPGAAVECYFRGHKAGHNQLYNQAVLSPELADRYNEATVQTNFFVIGEIRYRDDIGTLRRVKFTRRWDGGLRRFTAINDPFYEREL